MPLSKPRIFCRVRVARLEAGHWRLGDFAKLVNISISRLSRIETGWIYPSFDERKRIVARLPGEDAASLWPTKNGRRK